MTTYDYAFYSVEMGNFLLDGGAMFGIVPKVMWEKKIPADDNNRIPMKGRALLITGNNRNILVDTGCGSKLSEKQKAIYGISNAPENPDEPLHQFGLSASDITDVILTHLHFDHAGGATCIKNGEVVPSYPNARYYVGQKQWEWAKGPSIRDRASYLPENYLPLMAHNQLTVMADDHPFPIEGIRFIRTNGHTPGQIHPVISSGDTTVFYCGDLIPTSAHVLIPWHMGYDNAPLTLIKEKETVLKQAVRENWILFFEHDPVVSSATVRQGKKGFEIDAVVEEIK